MLAKLLGTTDVAELFGATIVAELFGANIMIVVELNRCFYCS